MIPTKVGVVKDSKEFFPPKQKILDETLPKRGRGHCARDGKAYTSIPGGHVRLRQLWAFITRENASLASLARLIISIYICIPKSQ